MPSTTAGLAAYQRVAEAIREDIRSGRLKPGDQLPGNRDVAERYGVALGTAQKALKVLQDEGWLIATPSVGVFVNDRIPGEAGSGADTDLAAVRAEVAELRRAVGALAARVDALESRERAER